ncbi:Ankyrin repeat and sterile alpha motif domain-containing protein 1B [Trichoplax sp. H2]|nr:Ankyrin repeat and sterile alpha motif domain-containing protein 1B [Trichoplax sp. H2]|eukprot:RDD43795.1 Ankyrin repeat and sterile alpha motif domain-containing protein 1B [Trichoplax sp. H2]
MGREADLIKAAIAGDVSKLEKLLNPNRNFFKKIIPGSSATNDHDDGEVSNHGMEKIKVHHIDVNCRDENGYTPLILAILHGNHDAVECLLKYSAGVNEKDPRGNGALHIAAWKSKSDIVDVLLQNGAGVNDSNNNGNSPLHFACQYNSDGKIYTVLRLLQWPNIDVMKVNNSGQTALDLAAQYDKKEIVSLLLDHQPKLISSTYSLIEASKTGRTAIVEILLDAGMDPNLDDSLTGTCALHEAIRYYRTDIARLLLEFGADPNHKNWKGQVPLDCLKTIPENIAAEFREMIKEYEHKTVRTPKTIPIAKPARPKQAYITDMEKRSYPLLKNFLYWTRNDPLHSSECDPNHPCVNILNDTPNKYVVFNDKKYCSVVFDLNDYHIITGIRITGWNSPKMLKEFAIERGRSIRGPWTSIKTFSADLRGPSNLVEAGLPQNFKEFECIGQYFRLMIYNNHGGDRTCFHSIKFYGVELGVMRWFDKIGFVAYAESFAVNVKSSKIADKIVNRIAACKRSALTKLEWVVPPQNMVVENHVLNPFTVEGDPHSNDIVTVTIRGSSGILIGETSLPLISCDDHPSLAIFTELKISDSGTYMLEVKSQEDSSIYLKAKETIHVEKDIKSKKAIDDAFDELNDLLMNS